MNSFNSKHITREQALLFSTRDKMKYLYALQVDHKKLKAIGDDLRALIAPYNEVGIITVIGATGVGKTTLSSRFIGSLVKRHLADENADSGQVPYVFINAPANGDRSLSWRAVYEAALRQVNEPLVDKKVELEVNDGKVFVKPGRYKTLGALRQSLQSMLKERQVQVLAIDEAFHLLRFGNYSAVMDTLKSLADQTGVKIVLLGTYDLFDLATEYGQVSRRSEVLHFQRYLRDNPDDKAEYKRIVGVIQQRWPCEEVPRFDAISDELMQATLGCIGLLKALVLNSLAAQLKNKGKWKPEFLAKAAKSFALVETIRSEIEKGEAKLKGGTYGESMFGGTMLAKVAEQMQAAANA